MPDTLTNNYSWVMPQISGSPTTWGRKLNDDLVAIDAQMKANADTALPLTGGTLTGPLVAPKISVTTAPVGQNDVVRLADMPASPAAPVLVPIGGVVMWVGTTAPLNWLICNGGTFSTTTYPALAAVLGTTYGPAGKLPDFTESGPVGPGPDAGLGVTGSTADFSFGGDGAPFVAINFIIRAL
jgi:hypothetical protein